MTSINETGLVIEQPTTEPEGRKEWITRSLVASLRWYISDLYEQRETDRNYALIITELLEEMVKTEELPDM